MAEDRGEGSGNSHEQVSANIPVLLPLPDLVGWTRLCWGWVTFPAHLLLCRNSSVQEPECFLVVMGRDETSVWGVLSASSRLSFPSRVGVLVANQES